MNYIIGIDISKDTLDVHRLADGQHMQVLNGIRGFAELFRWIEPHPTALIIFEATGPYHRQLEQALCVKGIPFVKVNPKQARRFAQASGKLAKTDRVDCEMLAKMGAALQLMPKPISAENLYDLRDLLAARRALIKDRTAAKARNATVTHALVKRQLEKRLRQIKCDIAKIDAAMLEMARQDLRMTERLDILSSIPGVGVTTALIILVDMPEIGELDGKQVASLAGHAPMSQSSGKWQGKARIQGGRPNLRHAIFMPALVAIRFNADLKAKYDQLVAAGKEKKVAITAVMRKLLVLANALLRDQRMWSENQGCSRRILGRLLRNRLPGSERRDHPLPACA
ncbi:IS110 family transposase [Rhodobacterales bacterium 56_14_T64]|nr:IS110 family transposase [Rhodobacterales bacterium 56_14_T64]